jgi:hypothetical protein
MSTPGNHFRTPAPISLFYRPGANDRQLPHESITGTVDRVSGSPRTPIRRHPTETTMKKILFLLAILGAAAAAVAALRPDDVKAGAKKASDSVSDAAQQAKAKVKPAADSAADAVSDAADTAEQAADDAVDAVKDAAATN